MGEAYPSSFVFDVKAFRLFTQHQTPPQVLPPDMREALGPVERQEERLLRRLPPGSQGRDVATLRLALEPLRAAGKLGAVLFQFPPWFFYRRSNLAHIAHCAQVLEGYQLASSSATERGSTTSTGEVLAFEREHGLAHVVVDEPHGFSSSIPAVWEVTVRSSRSFACTGGMRRPGRRRGSPRPRSASTTSTTKEELREFIQPVRRLAQQAQRVHVVFNNNLRDQGIRGAKLFSGLLDVDRRSQ